MSVSGKSSTSLEGNALWIGGNALFFLAGMLYVIFGHVTLYRIASLAILVALITEIYVPLSSV